MIKRIRLWAGIGTIAMLLSGGQGLMAAIGQAQSGQYSMQQYLSQRPATAWLKLGNAQLDIQRAGYARTGWFGFGRELREIYVPVFAGEDGDRDKIRMVVSSQNAALLETTQAIHAAGNQGSAALQQYLATNQANLLVQREVAGHARPAAQLDEKTRGKLQNLYGTQLAEDFVLVAGDAGPNYLLAGGLLIGGVALGSWVARPWVRREGLRLTVGDRTT
jgi:hypothetical protein